MGLSKIRKEKKIEYVTMTKKALAFDQLLKTKEQGQTRRIKISF